MNIEEIKDRVNLTKNAFHKLGIEGQVNINVMLNDIEFLLKEIEELKNGQIDFWISDKEIEERIKNKFVSKDKIKAKIEEIKNKPVKDEFITASQGKLDTIIEIESLLDKEE